MPSKEVDAKRKAKLLGFNEYREALQLMREKKYEQAQALLQNVVQKSEQELGATGVRSLAVVRNQYLLVYLLRLQNTEQSIAAAKQAVLDYRSKRPQHCVKDFPPPSSPLKSIAFDSNTGTLRFAFLSADDAPHFYGSERQQFDRVFELDTEGGEYIKKVKYYQISKKGDPPQYNTDRLTDLTFTTNTARQVCFRERIPFFTGLRRRELAVHSSSGGIIGLRRYADQPQSPVLGFYTMKSLVRERHASRTTPASTFDKKHGIDSVPSMGAGYASVPLKPLYVDSYESGRMEVVIMAADLGSNNALRRMPSPSRSGRWERAGVQEEHQAPDSVVGVGTSSSTSVRAKPNEIPDYLEGLSVRIEEDFGSVSVSHKVPRTEVAAAAETVTTAGTTTDSTSANIVEGDRSAAKSPTETEVNDELPADQGMQRNASQLSLFEDELDDTDLLLKQEDEDAQSEFSFGSFGSFEDATEKVNIWDSLESWTASLNPAAATAADGVAKEKCCTVC